MLALTQNVQLEVSYPPCARFHSVPGHLLEKSQRQEGQIPESQRLLDEPGPWFGMARSEFPAPHVASPETTTRFPCPRPPAALRNFEGDAVRRGPHAVCVERGATPQPPRDAPRRDSTAATTTVADLELELERWENEGGAPGPTR